jgi:hypothetical protein
MCSPFCARASSPGLPALVIQSSQSAPFAHSNFGSPQTGNYFGERPPRTVLPSLSVPAVDFRKGPRKQQVCRGPILRPVAQGVSSSRFPGLLTWLLPNRTDKMKFLKTSRVCLVTRGRYAGKKVRHSPRTSLFCRQHRISGGSRMGHGRAGRRERLAGCGQRRAAAGARVEEITRRTCKREPKC